MDVKTKGTINYMWQRKHVRRKEKEEKKKDVPQTRAHQVGWDG